MNRKLLIILFILSTFLSARNIEFAGRTWFVHNGHYGPGPNYFSDDISNVWLDASGYLHLRLRESGGIWYCPNVQTVEPTGYGMHRFYVTGSLTNLDPNIIFSPFVYYDTSHEIDIEFARWGNSTPGIHNAQFVVQPYSTSGNLHTFESFQNSADTTHYFDWRATNIHFKSFSGHYSEEQNPEDLMQEWNYSGEDNPNESFDLNIHIIIWLLNGDAPTDGQEVEMIIKDVDYPCYETPDFEASDGTFSNFVKITWGEVESADNYEVWRSLDTSASHAEKIADNILTNFYDDYSAGISTNYYYWVVGENPFGTSKFGAPDLGWHGESNEVATSSVNFFYDGFTRKDGAGFPEYKWTVSGWSSGNEISYCSNNMCYIFPGNGDWNWRGIRPIDVQNSDCILLVNQGDGVKVSINLEAMDISVSNTSSHDASVNIAILNKPVTGNPYEMDAEGLLLYADYYADTGKINLRLYKKSAPNSVGTSICDVEKNYIPGANISLTFAKDNANVIYNNESVFYGAHGIDTSASQNRYAGIVMQNREYARCAFFLDNAKISAFGNSFADSFNDDFNSTSLDETKWFNTSGSATIVDNKCKLTPDNNNWATANLGAKIDRWNPMKLAPVFLPLEIDVKLAEIEVNTVNASAPEIMFKTELYPERNLSTSWNYNFTNLSLGTDINIYNGETSLNVCAFLYTRAETFDIIFCKTNITYKSDADFQYVLGETNIAIYYDGNLLGGAAHNIDIGSVYENGIFPMFIAQNYDAGRGAISLDNVNIMAVPEPCYLLLLILLVKKTVAAVVDRGFV